MSPVIAEPISRPHLALSTRLVYELGDPHSTLRATTDRRGGAVLINAGGEVDASEGPVLVIDAGSEGARAIVELVHARGERAIAATDLTAKCPLVFDS